MTSLDAILLLLRMKLFLQQDIYHGLGLFMRIVYTAFVETILGSTLGQDYIQ